MKIAPDLAATVLAVVDEGSFESAARRLHVTPSAVSQRIRALEDALGAVLLVRAKPPRPTEAGATIVRLARQQALLEQEALTELGVEDRLGRVRLSVAANADSLATWFLDPLARLAERLPVVFEVHRDDQDFTARLLSDGTAVAAVTAQSASVAGCSVSALGAMVYEAYATPAFVRRWFPSGATVEALADAPVVDFDRRDDLQTRWIRERGASAASPPRHFIPASADFATAVRSGIGWGMLPDDQARDAVAAGALLPLGGPGIRVPLYWQQWNLHSTLLAAVADEVSRAARAALAPISRR